MVRFPDIAADERDTLEQLLDFHRRRVLNALDGLSDDDAASQPEPAGDGVPVHPGAESVAQDRPTVTACDGVVDNAGNRGWQRDEDDFAALAAHAQDPVAVLLAKIAHAGTAGLEDP